ncbi:MAG: hypothetical protein ACRECP_12430 [Methylocella sp.]
MCPKTSSPSRFCRKARLLSQAAPRRGSRLIARLKPRAPRASAAAGGFETVAAASLAAEGGAAVVSGCGGLPVIAVNPRALRGSFVSLRARSARRLRAPSQVRAVAKALGRRAKTDPIDAMVIARFSVATKP